MFCPFVVFDLLSTILKKYCLSSRIYVPAQSLTIYRTALALDPSPDFLGRSNGDVVVAVFVQGPSTWISLHLGNLIVAIAAMAAAVVLYAGRTDFTR